MVLSDLLEHTGHFPVSTTTLSSETESNKPEEQLVSLCLMCSCDLTEQDSFHP